MKIILRHIFSSIFLLFITVLLVLVMTFVVFPLDDYKVLLEAKLFNMLYIYWIGIVIVLFGLITGVGIGQERKQEHRYLERQLQQLLEGQALVEEDYKDLKKIDQQIKQLQEKITQHIEHAQDLATEQANEREASLQEVVIEERNRLARDLHDAVSQQLFAASMMMSAINEADYEVNSDLKHQLAMVEKMIQQSQLEMRALLLHLRPVQLKGKQLQEGMKDLIAELMTRLPIALKHDIEEFPIDKGIENQLFRILQEAVSNTLRHADANKMHISLIKREGFIIMRIVDDGKGFDMTETSTSSYGLDTMKERSEDLGGNFKVVSLPNKGTRIEVKIPSLHE